MENSTLFNLDMLEMQYPNLRDLMSGYQLSTLQNADRIVARALKEGMKKKLHYKDIYKLAKERIEYFVELVGKSPIEIIHKIHNNFLNDEKNPQLEFDKKT
jgi:hypothetical protein